MKSNINYSLLFTLSEVKKLLSIEKKYILDCIYHFPEHFSTVSKLKGLERKFNTDDIRVLAYVNIYWEDEPDYYCIEIGLNRKEQYEEHFDNLINEIVPIFLEPTDQTIHNTNSVLMAGVADSNDLFSLAKSFKKSGDELINQALDNDEKYEFAAPAIYCYRHCIELFLKSFITKKSSTHNLENLYAKFEKIIHDKFEIEIPSWFKNVILALHDFDGQSTTFRYGNENQSNEYLVDLKHFKNLMNSMELSFIKVTERMI